MPHDNYKRHQRRFNRSNSIDGFISSERFRQGAGSIGFRDQPEKTAGGEKTLDNFNRPDGYNSSSTPVAGTERQAAILPEGPRRRSDNLLPPKPPKKLKGFKRFFHRPKSWKKVFKRTALSLLALIIIIGGYLAYKLYITQRHILKGGGLAPAVCDGNVPVNLLKSEGDGRVNILLVGIGGPGHDGPDLTDTIMLVSLDTVNDKADLLSIPRDLWVQIPGYGSSKINQAYYDGKTNSSAKKLADKERDGMKLLDQTLKPIIGVPIHYHVLVDFAAFKDAVNSLGGVTVNVPEELYDPTIAWENNWNPVIAKKGIQHMNGAQALLYARSRETSSDFARNERQRLLMVAIKDKALSVGTFSNPLKISSLLDSLGNNVYSDFNLSSIKCLYTQGSQISSSHIKSLDLVTPPNQLITTGLLNIGAGEIGGCAPGPSCPSIDYPRSGLYNYLPIETFVRTALRDGFLAKENASINILNGTNTPGLATREANILKPWGYNIGTVGDAPTRNYQQTVLVDLKNNLDKYTRHYLEQRLGIKAVSKLPDKSISPGSADFVIILGTNAVNYSQN